MKITDKQAKPKRTEGQKRAIRLTKINSWTKLPWTVCFLTKFFADENFFAVQYTGMVSCATKFRTFSQKYEIYEIKSHTKISAITVAHPLAPVSFSFPLLSMSHLNFDVSQQFLRVDTILSQNH